MPDAGRWGAAAVALTLAANLLGSSATAPAVSAGSRDAAGDLATPRVMDVTTAAEDATQHPRSLHASSPRQPGPAMDASPATVHSNGDPAVPADSQADTPEVQVSGEPSPPAPTSAVTGPPYTALFMDGQVGQSYLDGEVVTETPADASFTTFSASNYVKVEALEPFDPTKSLDGHYSVWLRAADGNNLVPGVYTGAVWVGVQGPGQPGMSVAAHHTECTDVTGSFTVLEADYVGGLISAFAASFTFRCASEPETIVGEVRYGSSIGLTAMDIDAAPDDIVVTPVGTPTSHTVTVLDAGTTSLNLGSVGISGNAGFSIDADTCTGATLLPSATCTIDLTIDLAAVGPASATLSWTDTTPRGAHSVALSTTGVILLELDVVDSGFGSVKTPFGGDCLGDCAYNLGYLNGGTVTLQADARAGYAFSSWSGDCAGRAPCVLAMTTSRAVTATFVPILGSGAANLRVADGQAGYRDGEFGCSPVPCLEPSDSVVAVNATQVVTATNGTIRIRSRTGVLQGDLPLWAFFLEETDTLIGGDPQVVWDALHSRWLASEFSASCGTGYISVAISTTSNAAGSWLIYEFPQPGGLGDFPGLGLSSDKVAVGYNFYPLNNCAIGSFEGTSLRVLKLSDMLAGASVSSKVFFASNGFTFRPAAVLDGSSDLPVVIATRPQAGVAADHVGFAVVTGTGSVARIGPVHDLSVQSYLPPEQFGPAVDKFADPPTPGGFPNAGLNPIDSRPLSAIVRGGDLFFTANTGCTPPGDAVVRPCARVAGVHLRSGFDAHASSGEAVPPQLASQTADLTMFYDAGAATLRYSMRWGTFTAALSQPRAKLRYGAAGTNGPVMFELCPSAGQFFCDPFDPSFGSLTSANFVASPQVPTFAAAIAALQQGNAYLGIYSDFGQPAPDTLRGQVRVAPIAERLVFDDVIGIPGSSVFTPAIGFAGDGTAYLTFSRSDVSPGSKISTYATWAATTDVPGTFRNPAELARGQATYGGTRWGDYHDISPDPADGHAVWATHQVVNTQGTWQAWTSQLVAGAAGAATGTIAINEDAASTTYPAAKLRILSAAGAAATEALVSNSPALSGGALANSRRIPLGREVPWSLIEAAVGGTATTGTKTVYVQFGDGVGGWGGVVSDSITLLANPSLSRISGANRYATAAAISAGSFQPGVSLAFIATGANFPDALAGAAVAGGIGAPVLLVTSTAIPSATSAELSRLKPNRIVILGGTGVVSTAVENALASYSAGGVYRIAGSSRYATAANIAFNYFTPGVGTIFIATGTNFPDALAGAAAAGKVHAPILLVAPTVIPAATAEALAYLEPAKIVILGGTGAVSSAVAGQLDAYTTGPVVRLSGPDRYSTAVAISMAYNTPGVEAAFVATGWNFPDALAGAAVAGVVGGPVILVTPTVIPASSAAELDRLNPDRIVILGGTGAVSSAIELQLAAYVGP